MFTVRPHIREDIPLRVKWLNNQAANRFALEDPEHETTIQEQEEWFQKYEADPRKKFFTFCVDDAPIGFMGLSKIADDRSDANVFIYIGEDTYRGKGYGKEALGWLIRYASDDLGLSALSLDVDRRNVSACVLYQKMGFTVVRERDDEWEMRRALKTR